MCLSPEFQFAMAFSFPTNTSILEVIRAQIQLSFKNSSACGGYFWPYLRSTIFIQGEKVFLQRSCVMPVCIT